jgi:prolyl-tRNA editing enzyme YbaK/EbsC (Cys-tRNA(Pro) deacylase)
MMLSSLDLQTFLESQGVEARILHLDDPTPTVLSAAAALGVEPDQIVKSLLFFVKKTPVLAIAYGLQDVDRRVLASYFDVGRKRVKLAGAPEVLDISGYPVGAVPPVGWKTSVQAIIDPGVMRHTVVYAGGGDIHALVEISSHDIVRLSGAIELELLLPEVDA